MTADSRTRASPCFEQRAHPRVHLRMADGIQRADRRLPDAEVGVADQPQQRLERAAVAEPGQRRGDGHQQLAIVLLEQARSAPATARAIADPAERRGRRAPRLGVVAAQAARSADRPSAPRSGRSPRAARAARRRAEQMRQRALDRRVRAASRGRVTNCRSAAPAGAAAPPRSRAARRRPRSTRAPAPRCARRRRRTSRRSARWMRGQRVDDAAGDDVRADRAPRPAARPRPRRRSGRALRPPGRRPDRRRAAARSRGATAGSLMRDSASSAGNARKKSCDSAIAASRSTAAGRRQFAERLDRVKSHVHVLVVERARAARRRPRAALRAERQRRLNPQIGVGVLQQIDRATPVRSTPVIVSSCSALLSTLKLRCPSRSADTSASTSAGIAAAGHRFDGGAAHLPVLVGHRRRQRPEALDRSQRRRAVRSRAAAPPASASRSSLAS